ncbi:MAG: methionyl-tRNA formyltransferase [Schleiferiaceae bacterium]
MIRTVFFGTPDFAVTCLEALHCDSEIDVVAVVTAPDKPSGRGQQLHSSAVAQFARSQGLPLLQPERLRDPEFLEALQGCAADVFTVVAFRMLPEVVWAMPPKGSLNIHGSLLPDLRGAAPIQWSLAHGDAATGLTAFSLNHEIDEGPLLDSVTLQVDVNEPLGSLYERMALEGAALAVRTLHQLERGTLTPRAQGSAEKARMAPKLTAEFAQLERLLDGWSVHNRIRACDPFPGASIPAPGEPGQRFKVFGATWTPSTSAKDGDEIHYVIDNESFKIISTQGISEISAVQWPGKRRMPVGDFLRGSRLRGRFTLSGQKID